MLCTVIKSNTTNLDIYSADTHCNNFENLKANIFSNDTFSDNASDPDIYRIVVFLQENFYKENGLWDYLKDHFISQYLRSVPPQNLTQTLDLL